MVRLLHGSSSIIRKEVLLIINHLVRGLPEQRQALLDANAFRVLSRVVRSAAFENFDLFAQVVIGLLLSGTIEQALSMIDIGIVPALCRLLFVRDESVKLLAHWCLDRLAQLARGTGTTPHALFFVVMNQLIAFGEEIDRIRGDERNSHSKSFCDIVGDLTSRYENE